ncbi:ABC transporter substrate-binding protein [Pseudoalteromonas sp. SSDWG2]|uniref:ABC transporter substrate-binding protein n=1 Tax=Pseudoalteromonas sp. SSDWG2 TaxID=3139391 RepID=UPI003BAB0FCC
MKWLNWILMSVLLVFCVNANAKISVLFVSPSTADDPFWIKVEQFAQRAAQDLDMDLVVIHGDGHREYQYQNLNTYLSSNPMPDYAIVINYPGDNGKSMGALESRGIYFITLEQTLSHAGRAKVGFAQEKFKYWLSELSHDNEKAGYDLASALTEQAKISGIINPSVVAIGGHYGAETDFRFKGLSRYLSANRLQLNQLVHAQWRADLAAEQTKRLLRRYNHTNVIWSASDLMALSAVKEAQSAGKVINQTLFIGGFDWLDSALDAIENEQMSASIGGHFLMGAWALVALYDHAHQKDNEITVPKSISFKLALADSTNVKHVKPVVTVKNWQHINFKDFTLTHSHKQSYSSIDINNIIEHYFNSDFSR